MYSEPIASEDRLNTTRPLVSAIIPTYNHGQYLSRALDSILAQAGIGEQFDVEIIVVDDASTDATGEVIRRYPQIRYLRQPTRRGVSAAKNAGLRASTGEYVSFLDADDTWLPEKLRLQLPPLLRSPEVGVVYGQGIRRGAGEERVFPEASRAPSGQVFEKMIDFHFAVHGGCLLIRREAFDRTGYFDESLTTAEDLDLAFRLAFHCRFHFEPHPVMVYNISPHGLWLTSAATGSAARDHARVIEKALRMLPDSPRVREMREEALVRSAFHPMLPFVLIGDLPEARAKLLDSLRGNLWTARHPWVRNRVKWVAHKLLMNAASPLSEGADLCTQIKAATPGANLRERQYRRWILAEIWADIVVSGALRNRVGLQGVAYAAVRAVAYAPLNVALVYRIGRGLLRRLRTEFAQKAFGSARR